MEPTFRVGDWLVSPRLNRVEGNGRAVRLEPKVMQVLVCLAERPGEVFAKEELLRKVWADTFVTDEVLTRAVSELRRTFGDDAKQPRVIETVARGGYRLIAPVQTAIPARGNPLRQRRKALIAACAALLVAAAIAGVWLIGKAPRSVSSSQRSIAVLPLQNSSAAKELDFLRLGLADDIATTLSYFPSLSIRPFATTSRYAGADVNLQKAAEEMRVANIVTGHFAAEGGEVAVTLEAVDATSNRVLWRDTFRGSARDLSGIQEKITAGVHHGLIAALGISPASSPSAKGSNSEEAYELYLRAAFDENSSDSSYEQPIRLLERAVALDRGYAAAWARLGHLYYYEAGSLGNGGTADRLRAKAALQKAVALDPEQIQAAADLINMEEEEGELNRAYDETSNLLRQRPNSGAVHLVRAYVLWYPGLLDEASQECEKARSLDAGTVDLASCGHIFLAAGRYERAMDYYRLEAGTDFEKGSEVEVLVRQGKQDAALQVVRTLGLEPFYGRQLLEPCLQHRPPAEVAAGAQPIHAATMAQPDSFPKYNLSAWNSFCNQPALSVIELRRAIEQNYCAYPQMETDPLLENMRKMPVFAELRAAGIACQKRFLEHRKQSGAD